MQPDQRVVLITGASSGIGQSCAIFLSQRGYRVFGTSRHVPPPSLQTGWPPNSGIEMIPMDVDSDTSVQHGINLVLNRVGRIDVVVNNAGFGIAGAVEDTSLDEVKAQFETNFFGVWRVCCAVLPIMRRQRDGYIVNIGSIAGLIGVPFTGAYCASKFAVEGLTEALSAEVRSFGVHVVLIEPGDIVTPFRARRRRTTRQSSVYQEQFGQTLNAIETAEARGGSPETVARLLARIITTPSPRLRYTVGPAVQRAAVTVKKVLPDRLFERLLMRVSGMR